MIYGEHLCADEIAVQCRCGVVASVEVVDTHGVSHGLHCRQCGERKQNALRREQKKLEKLAKAIVRKGRFQISKTGRET